VLEDGFLDHVNEMGLLLKQQLAEIVDRFPDLLEEVRGYGLLQGIKCKVPNTDVIAAFKDHGLLAIGAGSNVVRFAPALIISADEIGELKTKAISALENFPTE